MRGCPNPNCWSKSDPYMLVNRYAGYDSGEDHWVECRDCEMRGPVHDTKEEAIAAWDELPRADDFPVVKKEPFKLGSSVPVEFPIVGGDWPRQCERLDPPHNAVSSSDFESSVEELVEGGRKIGMNSGLCVHSTGTFEFDEDGIRQLAGPGEPCTIPPDHPAIKDTQGRSVTIAMHQPVNGGEKWERGFTESKSVAEEAPSVDRDRYPHNCACGSPCYISPSPLHSECTGCDNPREAG